LELLSDIYIDESSQTNHRFLVLGGIIAETQMVDALNAGIGIMRRPELPAGEMKWNKVSRSKLKCYRRVVDTFFDHRLFSSAHFHSVVVDTSALDHHAFNEGSRDIGFNKEIYQLASKFARLYRGRLFHVYPDERDTNQRPEHLRTILNFGRRKAGDPRDWPFRRCHFRDSKRTPLLQLVDVLAGALAYRLNGHHLLPDASPAKIDLSEHVLRKAGVTDPKRDTSMSGKFTIWHRQLRKKASPDPR
jgi:hypothetical protein